MKAYRNYRRDTKGFDSLFAGFITALVALIFGGLDK